MSNRTWRQINVRVEAERQVSSGREKQWRRRQRLFECDESNGRQLMMSEGQAEPWAALTTPLSSEALSAGYYASRAATPAASRRSLASSTGR